MVCVTTAYFATSFGWVPVATVMPPCFKRHGIKTAAFVTSQSAKFGPWDVNNGLPTLEMHRHLPLELQATELEKKIVTYPKHFRRSDITASAIRSTMVRVKYAE